MSKTELTVNEVMESLSGFDEIAVEKHMNYDIYTDEETGNARPVLLLRCLVFVMERRGGLKDAEARMVAMEMRVGDVNDYFGDEPDELDPEEPETAEGKDDSLPVSEPTN
jgi:hypothetical protein